MWLLISTREALSLDVDSSSFDVILVFLIDVLVVQSDMNPPVN